MGTMQVQRNLPDILYAENSNLLHCDILRWKRDAPSCLVLTRQLSFNEYRKKQLLYSINLRESCLQHFKKRIQTCNGWRQPAAANTSVVGSTGGDETMQSSSAGAAVNTTPSELSFGKYVYRNRQIYILLHCWDKLLVLKRPMEKSNTETYQILAHYENVVGYRLVNDRQRYQALVEIEYRNGVCKCTDFQSTDNSGGGNIVSEAGMDRNYQIAEFKQLLRRITSARSELLLHREITQRDFERIIDKHTFGAHLVRAPLLEEKQLLQRTSNVWLRLLAATDELVIGIPLLNTCISSQKIVHSLRPLLLLMNNTTSVDGHDNDDLGDVLLKQQHGYSYKQRLYQLKRKFNHLNLATAEDDDYFQSQFFESQSLDCWHEVHKQSLMPESAAVLLLKFPLAQLVPYARAELFVCYEVQHGIQLDIGAAINSRLKTTTTTPKSQTAVSCYTQQLHLKSFDIAQLLAERSKYLITLCNDQTLQQDFLATIMTYAESCTLYIKYSNSNALAKFEELLATRFQFSICTQQQTNRMDVDMDTSTDAAAAETFVFYNREPTSQWYGMLMMRNKDDNGVNHDYDNINETTTHSMENYYDAADECCCFWRIHAPNKTKLFLLLRILFEDLLQHKHNVRDITLLQVNGNTINLETTYASADGVGGGDAADAVVLHMPTMQLESALREELRLWRQLLQASKSGNALLPVQLELNQQQMECDLLASVIKSNN